MKEEEDNSVRSESGPATSREPEMQEGLGRGEQMLNTISEYEGESAAPCQDPPGDSEQGRSSCFSSVSSDTLQPSMGDDCAAIILTCLFCQLSDFFHILPEVFNRALDRCFPSCKYLCALSEPNCDLDCCNCTLDLDCGLMGSCHEATELLELALEVSEVCHR
ncbi:myoD family inhibitor domain-containing protein 2 [Paramormyrops kingsleyae]|uniref:myoD family inhibitor domain-containing protein 2 n=1 Tax=Paramormyrops kingsleyae TaxID=1676925 RepID=UPI000CD620D5|nr:myoD family inhibitor domain-containing protein 2 [Paramormyrops kingsleyae]XP_023664589.1 myoD family inhibitor domain-containing protein 2 [Paramormyrops kingsleyae]